MCGHSILGMVVMELSFFLDLASTSLSVSIFEEDVASETDLALILLPL